MLNCSAVKQSKTLISSFNSIPNSTKMNSINDKNPNSLSSQQRVVLLQSISQFFQLNGFSKTLKYFLKEAQIEKDGEEVCSLNIEEMCYEYLKSRNDAKEAKATEMEANQGKKSEPTPENGVLDGLEVKSKKSKKSKSAKDCSEQVIERTQPKPKPADYPEETPSSLPSAPGKKSKDKKKKHKDELEDLQEKPSEIVEHNVEKKEKKEKKVKKEKNGSSKKEENVEVPSGTTEAGERKKESKKRKKPSSEENDAGCVEEPTLHDSKRSKTDKSEQSNGLVQPPKTPNGSANGVFEKAGAEKSQKQDKTKELNGSAEPKTAKAAFQRVKAEDVEFADERLQDNSYWAKDGADSGYGAKAQEVLGQVRGRDFRHEKTKKKRGSYRGGQIDLHTHSVKFNYEDEDE